MGKQALDAGTRIYELAKQTISFASDIERTSKALGMSSDQFQKWDYIAKAADIDINRFTLAMRGLITTLGEIREGKQPDLARILGLTGTETLEAAIRKIATRFETLKDGTAKAELSMKVFGSRVGIDMVAMMNLGEKGIDGFTKQFQKLGGAIEISKLAELEKQLNDFEFTMKRAKVEAVGPFVETILTVAEGLGKVYKALKDVNEEAAKLSFKDKGLPKMEWVMGSKYGQKEFSYKDWAKYTFGGQKTRHEIAAEHMPGYEVPPELEKAKEELGEPLPEPDWIKKWVEQFDGLGYAYKQLGTTSTATTETMIKDSLRYAKYLEDMTAKGEASTQDLINAYAKAAENLKKLPKTYEQIAKEENEIENKKYDSLIELQEDYEKAVKELADDPDKKKKVQKLIDDWLKARKKIIDEADKSKLELKATTDVTKAKETLDNLIKEYDGKTINLNIKTSESGTAGGGGGGNEWLNYVKGGAMAGGMDIGGMGASIDRISQQIRDVEAHGMTIPIYGEGSSRKPITEKIQEIIDEFGGLDKALTGMEVQINVAELSAEYNKLAAKLAQVERIIPDMSAMASWAGGSPYVSGPIVQTVTDLIAEYTEQMKILIMKMDLERLKGYGSMQSGGIVPRTGLYKLHEGERVISKSITSSPVYNFNISGQDPKAICNEIAKQLKYKRSGALAEAIR